VIIYTRFIRPAMPPAGVPNVNTYISPAVEKARRDAALPPQLAPVKPEKRSAVGVLNHEYPVLRLRQNVDFSVAKSVMSVARRREAFREDSR